MHAGRVALALLPGEAMPEGCRKCALAEGRSKIVVSRESGLDARVLFVGEAPGAEEDARGLPFVGRSGKLLDQWIEAMGLADDFAITNICRCRPPDNRTPTRAERDACGPHLARLIAERGPRVIVALGRTSEAWLKEHGYAPLFIYHPSYYVRGYRKWPPDVERLAREVRAALASG